ncbi:MAG: TetR/AcrR family transcriptional regulator [Lachnospiraceae bacterium]|jgi:AcrR family transcriptional regulator|nr:TetR/AcrR family transcriptional regulator [Lachnospiraceae bacterium]
MARKETNTRNSLLEAAFAMVTDEGMAAVTARKLAAKAGCSTQPIFRLFKGMEEVYEELFMMAIAHFGEFFGSYQKGSKIPFVDLGMAYIGYAAEYKNIFTVLFIAEERYGKALYDLINGDSGEVGKELTKAKEAGCKDAAGMFMKMWMLIHGAACMSLTGDYDLGADDTRRLLEESYAAFS